MKKILRIIARLNIGGPAIHAILLTEGLDKNRFETLLVCGSLDKDEGDMLYYALQKNINPIFIQELKRKLNLLSDIIALRKIYLIIKKERPDIIHTHTAKAGALGRIAGVIYNIFTPYYKRANLIHTFHGHVFSGYFNKFKSKLFILIERFLALFTCSIVTISESVKRELISLRICKESKIKVIPLGFELEKFLRLTPRDDTILNIGIIGRLVPIKNHRLFLEAADIVIRDNPQMKLRFKIIGDGQLSKELEEYAHKLGLDTQVNFLGWQRDLAKVYSDLDIVALTSINEGTPVSLIEAMASSRAVIATEVGGVSDLLGKVINSIGKPKENFKVLERGIMVRARDPISFAQALSFLLKNKALRRNMGALGRVFVKDRFTKDRLVRDIEGLYNKII